MSKLKVSLSVLDAVATATKTFLSKWVDTTELTPFDDQALGEAIVEALGDAVGDPWHPWPDEVPPEELDEEWLLTSLHHDAEHDFVVQTRWADGKWHNSGMTVVTAWKRNPEVYRRAR